MLLCLPLFMVHPIRIKFGNVPDSILGETNSFFLNSGFKGERTFKWRMTSKVIEGHIGLIYVKIFLVHSFMNRFWWKILITLWRRKYLIRINTKVIWFVFKSISPLMYSISSYNPLGLFFYFFGLCLVLARSYKFYL